jgi:hypothetical protein
MRVDKEHLREWIVEALESLGGSAQLVDICREVWQRHEHDLRDSGNLFYTWQYDIRWAANQLRATGRIRAARASPRGVWELRRR